MVCSAFCRPSISHIQRISTFPPSALTACARVRMSSSCWPRPMARLSVLPFHEIIGIRPLRRSASSRAVGNSLSHG